MIVHGRLGEPGAGVLVRATNGKKWSAALIEAELLPRLEAGLGQKPEFGRKATAVSVSLQKIMRAWLPCCGLSDERRAWIRAIRAPA